MSDKDDDEGEYMDPITSTVLTTSRDSNPWTEEQLSSVVEIELPQETVELDFGTYISQSVFLPSSSSKEVATND